MFLVEMVGLFHRSSPIILRRKSSNPYESRLTKHSANIKRSCRNRTSVIVTKKQPKIDKVVDVIMATTKNQILRPEKVCRYWSLWANIIFYSFHCVDLKSWLELYRILFLVIKGRQRWQREVGEGNNQPIDGSVLERGNWDLMKQFDRVSKENIELYFWWTYLKT